MYRIPGESFVVTQSFAEHVAATGLGAIDFRDNRGTMMRAQEAGVVTAVDNNPSGAEGRQVYIRYDGRGDEITQAHALLITAVRGQRVAKGDQIGISAGSGFGEDFYYGPHIHNAAFDSAGRRFDHASLIDWASAAGGGSTPLLEPKEETMSQILRSQSRSDDWVIPAPGMSFMLPDNGPVRPLSQKEYDSYVFWSTRGFPVRFTDWPGNDIRDLTRSIGLAEWEGFPVLPADNIPRLTGRLIFEDWMNPRTPGGGSATSGTGGDTAAILAKLAALDEQADDYQERIEALIGKVPDAVVDEQADRLTGK
ncbi:MAG: family peptidase [Rhodoglobus sp.]|nr:family peptidase [Rhodoglobus sp.]